MTRAGLDTGSKPFRGFACRSILALAWASNHRVSIHAAASLKPDAEAERERAEYNT